MFERGVGNLVVCDADFVVMLGVGCAGLCVLIMLWLFIFGFRFTWL